jgi:hypothetical protein
VIDWQEVRLEDLTRLRVRYTIAKLRKVLFDEYDATILRISVGGKYAGDQDARSVFAAAAAAIYATSPDGVIVDLSRLEYRSGDALAMLFDIGVDRRVRRVFVVGPACETGIVSLRGGMYPEIVLTRSEDEAVEALSALLRIKPSAVGA